MGRKPGLKPGTENPEMSGMVRVDTEGGRAAARPRIRMGRLPSFLLVYAACAFVFQLGGATPRWGPASPLEAFCAGLFGMLAWMSLLLALRTSGWRRVFWLASLTGLAALGVDELFDLHESSRIGHAADHLKVGLWIGAAGALAVVCWIERPSRGARAAMLLGFFMHSSYLALEIGDGGYFRLPLLSTATLELGEGLCELAMLSAYLYAFGAIASESVIGRGRLPARRVTRTKSAA